MFHSESQSEKETMANIHSFCDVFSKVHYGNEPWSILIFYKCKFPTLCVGNSCFCCPPLLSTDISDLLECVANILKITTDCVGRTFDDQNPSHIIYTFNDKLLVADFHLPSLTFSRLNRPRFMLSSYCFKLITRLIYALLT